MDPDRTTAPTANRRIALLIDADNVSHSRLPRILAELAKHGTANIRRAYGDWAEQRLKGWKDKLHEFAVRPIQQFSYTSGKNATDIALVIDAMELLYTQKLDAFCIASSDADFTPLVMQIKANGHDVYGFGERKTPEAFVNACTTFLYLDGDEAGVAAAVPTKAAGLKPATKALKSKPLAQDPKLVTILRGAIEASARDDGWATLSAAVSAAKRQAPIDPRNYGEKNFPALFEKAGPFVMRRGDNGQAWVADKGNMDRSPEPALDLTQRSAA